MGKVLNFRHQLKALWKWALSFRSRTWALEDYPMFIRSQKPDPDSPYANNPRFKEHRYRASLINWFVNGSGDTIEEAMCALRTSFEARRSRLLAEGRPIPRPGVHVPIEFASQDRVSTHLALADDFIHRVLGMEWAFITDESSLSHFHTEETNEGLVSRIQQVYGVDVSDIESGRIYEILERIAAHGGITQ